MIITSKQNHIKPDVILKNFWKKINDAYWNQEISSELGLVIGSITASQQLIDRALERKGGTFVMCKALEEWEEEIKLKYLHEGLREGKREYQTNHLPLSPLRNLLF